MLPKYSKISGGKSWIFLFFQIAYNLSCFASTITFTTSCILYFASQANFSLALAGLPLPSAIFVGQYRLVSITVCSSQSNPTVASAWATNYFKASLSPVAMT
jgi:hypothetical protein